MEAAFIIMTIAWLLSLLAMHAMRRKNLDLEAMLRASEARRQHMATWVGVPDSRATADAEDYG